MKHFTILKPQRPICPGVPTSRRVGDDLILFHMLIVLLLSPFASTKGRKSNSEVYPIPSISLYRGNPSDLKQNKLGSYQLGFSYNLLKSYLCRFTAIGEEHSLQALARLSTNCSKISIAENTELYTRAYLRTFYIQH